MAKLYVSLAGLIAEHRLVALGHNCWTSIQSEYGICGCGVFSYLEDDGYPIACETDVYGAASLLLQKVVAKQLGVETRPFFMDWTIQHPTDPNLFQAWHCGKAPISTFAKKPAIRTHEILGPLLGENVCGGTMEGEFRTGPVTLFRLTEYGGKFRAMITRGVIETSDWKNMRGSWGWVRVKDLAGLYRCLIEKGFSHHVSLMYGDHAELTAATCRELQMEVVWVE
jgi:L-fucose isomerase-like protein